MEFEAGDFIVFGKHSVRSAMFIARTGFGILHSFRSGVSFVLFRVRGSFLVSENKEDPRNHTNKKTADSSGI